MQLGKYLYGLPQAGHHFNNHFDATMKALGFANYAEERCAYVRASGGQGALMMALHVDDMLVVGKTAAIDEFFEQIGKTYKVTVERGPQMSYIGLAVKQRADKSVLVAQTGYRRSLLSRFKADMDRITRAQHAPAADFLLNPLPVNDDPTDPAHYLSMIMGIMYLARLTRADLLFATTYLSTFASKPTMSRYAHAC